jgi:hypothetical protein
MEVTEAYHALITDLLSWHSAIDFLMQFVGRTVWMWPSEKFTNPARRATET